MTLLIIVLIVALLGVLLKRHALGSSATPLMIGLAVAALALVVFKSCGTSASGPTRAETVSYPTAVGFRLGQALAEDLPAGAKVLVIHSGDAAHVRRAQEVLDSYLDGLQKGSAERTLVIVAYVPDLPREERMMLGQEYLPAELFDYAKKDHPDAQAWVSLLGPPQFQRMPAPGTLPPIYSANVVIPEIARPLLQQGILRAIVFERTDGDRTVTPTRQMSPTEVFDLRYTMERPAAR